MHLKSYWKILLLVFICCSSLLHAQNQQKVDSLLQHVKSSKTPDTTQIKAYNDLGIQYAPTDPVRAKKYIYQALLLAKKNDRTRGIAGSYNCLGIVYYYQKEYDSAQTNFQKALEMNKELGHLWGQAAALNQIGAVQNLKDEYTAAIQSFKKAGEIFKTSGDSLALAKSIQNIGVSYSRMENHQKAIEAYLQAIQLYEELDNAEGIGGSYLHIGVILTKQHEYAKALEYLNEAQPKLKDANKNRFGSVLSNMGICYRGLKDYDTALYYFQEALTYKKLSKNKKIIASIQANIGDTYYDMKVYNQALEYQKEALENYSLDGNTKEKVASQNAIAKTYIALNELSTANDYATKAIQTSKTIGYLEGEMNAYQTLATVAKIKGENGMALNYYMTFQAYSDSLSILRNQKQVRELRTIYETEKRDFQIETQRKDIALLQEKATINNLQRIILGIGLFALVIISAFVYYSLKQKEKSNLQEKTKLETELAYKKKELTNHALHLAKKNEVLDKLKQKAKKLQTNDEPKKGYQELIRTINFDLNDDNHWGNFSKRFEEVHKDFNSNIKNKFPDITTNELRLMSLLKMNLTSKEMANILNISPNGVKKALYRLRKKLNTVSEDSLQDIVLNS
mgnify:FL=1|tara:strand:- start:85778 stop:87649 length:1872 start_codon:yes stop_codon:yes gene_type:complete